jgi:hypothetical protein
VTRERVLTVFVDANVLAKPVTRTLLIRCEPSGWSCTWSVQAETEANRHLRPRAQSLTTLRARHLENRALAPTGAHPERFTSTAESDRQILADAVESGAAFIVTDDVDDYGEVDLITAGISAVHYDLFLAEKTESMTYSKALSAMVRSMRNPRRTAAELHGVLAKVHPRLFTRFGDLYKVDPITSGRNESRFIFRGTRCLRCAQMQPNSAYLTDGICTNCRTTR